MFSSYFSFTSKNFLGKQKCELSIKGQSKGWYYLLTEDRWVLCSEWRTEVSYNSGCQSHPSLHQVGHDDLLGRAASLEPRHCTWHWGRWCWDRRTRLFAWCSFVNTFYFSSPLLIKPTKYHLFSLSWSARVGSLSSTSNTLSVRTCLANSPSSFMNW